MYPLKKAQVGSRGWCLDAFTWLLIHHIFFLAHLHKLANEPLGSACLCCVWICRQGLVLFLRLLCGWLEETKDFMVVQLALYPRALSPAQKADRMQLHPKYLNRTPSQSWDSSPHCVVFLGNFFRLPVDHSTPIIWDNVVLLAKILFLFWVFKRRKRLSKSFLNIGCMVSEGAPQMQSRQGRWMRRRWCFWQIKTPES